MHRRRPAETTSPKQKFLRLHHEQLSLIGAEFNQWKGARLRGLIKSEHMCEVDGFVARGRWFWLYLTHSEFVASSEWHYCQLQCRGQCTFEASNSLFAAVFHAGCDDKSHKLFDLEEGHLPTYQIRSS